MKLISDWHQQRLVRINVIIPSGVVIGTWAALGVIVVLALIWAIRWRHSPPVVWLTPLILALPIAGAIAVGLWGAAQPWPRPDRLALLTLVAGGTALVLAGAAAVIAAAAFRQSVETPVLGLDLYFHEYPPNKAILLAGPPIRMEALDGWGEFRTLAPSHNSALSIRIAITNKGKVTATHVAVRLTLIDLSGLYEAQSSWKPLPNTFWTLEPFMGRLGCATILWEGGGDEVVHANWTRILPPLSLGGVRALHSFAGSGVAHTIMGREQNTVQHMIIAEAVADGIKGPAVRREVMIELVDSEEDQGSRLAASISSHSGSRLRAKYGLNTRDFRC